MSHWVNSYVGRSYAEVGMCWGLVQTLCMERLGAPMPGVAVGTRDSQAAAIRGAVRGWRRHRWHSPFQYDIVVMQGSHGAHVGFAVQVDGQIQILHAEHSGVILTPYVEMFTRGYHRFEFWSLENAR